MAENEIPQNQNDGIEDIEIQPLSDEALEDVAGGRAAAELGEAVDGSSNCCSCNVCSSD